MGTPSISDSVERGLQILLPLPHYIHNIPTEHDTQHSNTTVCYVW